jgi:hypothetical protein
MRHLFILLKYRLLGYKNALTHGKGGWRTLLLLAIFLLIPVVMFSMAQPFLEMFSEFIKKVKIDILLNGIAFVLFSLYGFTTSSNIFMTMRQLFASGYFENLIPLPISKNSLFATKVLELVMQNYLDLLLTLPIVVVVMNVFSVRPVYWPFVIFLLVLVEFSLSFIVMILILAAVRFLSRKATNFMVWSLNIISVLSFMMIQNYPATLMDKSNPASILKVVRFFEADGFRFLPTRWLVNVMYGFSTGDMCLVAKNYAIFLFLFFFLFFLARYLFDSCFHAGWQCEQSGQKTNMWTSKRTDRNQPAAIDHEARDESRDESRYEARFKARNLLVSLMKRELAMILRSSQMLYKFFIFPIVFIVFTVAGISLGNMSGIPLLIFSIYVSMQSSTMLSFSVEGFGIMMFKSFPFTVDKLFWAKYIVYGVLNILTASACYLFFVFAGGFPYDINHWYVFLVMLFAMCWLNLLMLDIGFYYADYRPQSNKGTVSLSGVLLLLILVMAIIMATVSASIYYPNALAALLDLIVFIVLLVQFFVHKGALARFSRGEFQLD